MSFKSLALAGATTLMMFAPVYADETSGDIMIKDAYARSSTAKSTSGAAFMVVVNTGTSDDRMIDARTDISKRTELHTHIEDSNGVMNMVHVEEGFVIPAGGMHMLERGSDHVMLMGLTDPLVQDETITLILTFEHAGEVTVEVPVDLTRKPKKMSH